MRFQQARFARSVVDKAGRYFATCGCFGIPFHFFDSLHIPKKESVVDLQIPRVPKCRVKCEACQIGHSVPVRSDILFDNSADSKGKVFHIGSRGMKMTKVSNDCHAEHRFLYSLS